VATNDDLIQPPLTEKSPLGSLSGWAFVVHCTRCGERVKAVDKIATKPSIYAKPVGEIVERFTCSGCGAKPAKLEGECVWARDYLPRKTRIDLTWLLPGGGQADERQQSLFG
jgi:hypothetical protein